MVNNGNKSRISPCLGLRRKAQLFCNPPVLQSFPLSKCFLFNYDLFPLPLPSAPASVKGALLSLVTRLLARPLASSFARCGRSPPEEAVCLGCQEPENGSAPSGDIAEDPGFPRRLKTSIWFRLPADTRRHYETYADQRRDRLTDRWSARTLEDRRRRLSTASPAAALEEKLTARPSCPAGCPRAEE